MPVRRIACAQLEARDLADAPDALDAALAAIAAAGVAGADLCVLPEGTWPAYVVGSAAAARAAWDETPDVLDRFGVAARSAGLAVVVGLLADSPGGLRNAAVHFGPDGHERNRVAKRFLWHFDRAWFAPGPAATPVDGVGPLICADGRLPEIAGALARAGAGLLVSSTAWVVARPAGSGGTNAQAEFLWRVRALETGAAAAAATKVGREAGVAMYSGRSQIVGPDGTVLAIASATEPELLVADVEVPDRPRPPAAREARPGHPFAPPLRPGTAHVCVVTHDDLTGALADHGCRLVVGPDGIARVDDLAVEILTDDDLLVPGPARAAAFAGVEVLVWLARRVTTPYVEEVARARAAENRVFVAVWRPVEAGGPLVVGPSGAVLAAMPPDADRFAVSATCLLAEAASKEVAPGTDVFAGALEL